MAYGGDFGEQPHDGTFIADGLCFSDHTPGTGLTEFKQVIAPCRVWLEHDEICIKNDYDFDNFENIVADYKIEVYELRFV